MKRWAREDDFEREIAGVHRSFPRVPVEVIKAVIGVESGFNPNAVTKEPGDTWSAGLMQMTPATANALGNPLVGDSLLNQMKKPAHAIYWGTKLLNDLATRLGTDWPAVYSAYNGGIRPHLGFGARVTRSTTVCLVRDLNTGDCAKSYTARPGEFGNQPHVDRFTRALEHFKGRNGSGAVALAIVGAAIATYLYTADKV